MKKFFQFFISKQFLYNLIAIAIVWAVIIFAEMAYLKSSTNFGEKIEVPTFYKIHMDDLDEFISGKNITYTIQDSVYMDDWPKGTVCWQYPKPTDSSGMSVKSGREILLSVVPINPQMIKMPKVTDMSQRMAESSLEAIGLRTKVSYQPASEGKGFVLKQTFKGKEIKPGTALPKGSRIELVVAQGSNGAATSLPNLVGLTISQAKERLSNLTLSLYTDCMTCETETDFANAVITEQNPRGGEGVSIAAGSTITVWATKAE
ncbi:PASTA domain-containing protein [Crocinitomix algicola]|uniref:PASTA domain-containing protein n=1 Tax=Crocinitomix algicola TaxID=1740263 RepID=UPI000873126C|nr:PASTA domain-containing protein [Crocinitomix algicola]